MECRVTMHLRELLEKRRRILFAVAACVNQRATQPLASCLTKQETVVMRAVVQRVSGASVTVGGEITGQIGQGLLVLLGVAATDSEADADYLAEKITGLRIFGDADDKMNRSATDIQAAILVVSQFTLYGDVRRGRRPSFDAAAPPDRARQLYEYFVSEIRAAGLNCQTGRFQEMMQVELVNEGPVTILLDSTKLF
jgi:D-aminoacyl-tRNA deacylase